MKLIVGQRYSCKAIEIKSYGAVMQFEDGSTQLLHISNLAEDFVKDVNDYITVGKTYEVTAVPGQVKPIEISMKVDPDEPLDIDNMSFEELLEYFPPTKEDIRGKRDGTKKRR